jgi:serine protease
VEEANIFSRDCRPTFDFRQQAVKADLSVIFVSLVVLSLAEVVPAGNQTGAFTTAGRPRWLEDEIIVKFKPHLLPRQINRVNQQHGTVLLYTSPFGRFSRLKIPAGKTVQELLCTYRENPDVQYAELNYLACAFFLPNDPYYPYQWNFRHWQEGGINMEPAWDITSGQSTVVVAVLDTGVAYETYKNFELAPDLASTNFVPGYDFVNNNTHPNDDDGHGTHIAGTITQNTNNNLGTAGVAFDCSIMPVKVLSRRGSGTYADIADGIYFAADNGAQIINLSLGGENPSITLEDALAYAYSKGVTIVCSAGNEYEHGNPVQYPAAYDQYCIAVAAARYDRARAPYSSTGNYVDLAAPGGDLSVDQNNDGYGDGILQQTFGANPKDWGYWFYDGTSMAAAHVSAIAALLMSTRVSGPDAVREALQETALDLGPAGWDEQYGWGLVDARAALNYGRAATGDLNSDGCVDYKDLQILADGWLKDSPLADIVPVTGDGIVNFPDFAVVAEHWRP